MSINFMGANMRPVKNITPNYFKPDAVTNTNPAKIVKEAANNEALNNAIKAKYMPHQLQQPNKASALNEAEMSYLKSHGIQA